MSFTQGGRLHGVLAVVVGILFPGCRAHGRPVCDALPGLDILRAEGTDREYLPELTQEPGVWWPTRDAVRKLRELGEPPLMRLADDGEVARCLYMPALWPVKVVGRMHHRRGGTSLYVQEADGCRSGPPWVVGKREERAVNDGAWSSFERCLDASRFETAASLSQLYLPFVMDGEGWLLEVVREGHYHAVFMHSPPLRSDDGSPMPLMCCDALFGFARPLVYGTSAWPAKERNRTW